MSSSRVIRGTKGKIFLYICAVLIITALVACYNNTLSQLEDFKKSNGICNEQLQSTNKQLQFIAEHKQSLEKTLKNEMDEHKKTKNSLENKLDEEKTKNEKQSGDAVIKYNTLQQHYNLLKTENDDLKEKNNDLQQTHLEEIKDIQSKLDELREELSKTKSTKDDLKVQNDELQIENINLKKQLKESVPGESDNRYENLLKEYESLKKQCMPTQDLKLSIAKSTSDASKLSQVLPSQSAVVSSSSRKTEVEADRDNPVAELPVMAAPGKGVSTSSTARLAPKPSQGSLNGARPLGVPTSTPKIGKANAAAEVLPKGVVAIPDKESPKEHPNEVVNARYQNKIEKDEIERENGAHEEFDGPNLGGLGFNDESNKQVAKPNIEKKEGNLEEKKQYDQDYKEIPNEMNIEEQEEEEDMDDYDHPRQKDPAIRN